ncbi:MAG: beta-N-acetylhexosaminidase [Myxococcales bacterium]
MDLHRAAASLVCIGFEGTAAPKPALDLIAQGVSGAILFRRNIAEAEQVAGLCASLKRVAGRPFLLSVDQEGGRVARLRDAPFTAVPTMREIGGRGDEALALDVGRLLGREVRAAGFDMDFAPVLDVDTNPANPVIGDRSLSRDPLEVVRLGVALGEGLESAGVASCGKHFPGHGDTSQDSHLTLPRLPHEMSRLREVELVPFAAWARAGLAAVMTAHVVFEAIEPGLPATFSERVQTGLLRGELGFRGVNVSDDLEMKAIADNYPMDEAAIRSVLAGVDLLLVCHCADRQQACIDGIAREAERSAAFRERVLASSRRVEKLLARFALPARDPRESLAALATEEHRALARRVASAGKLVDLHDPTELQRES